MIIPVEVIVVFLGAIIAIQGWILKEIVSLKVKFASYQELKMRVEHLEKRMKEYYND